MPPGLPGSRGTRAPPPAAPAPLARQSACGSRALPPAPWPAVYSLPRKAGGSRHERTGEGFAAHLGCCNGQVGACPTPAAGSCMPCNCLLPPPTQTNRNISNKKRQKGRGRTHPLILPQPSRLQVCRLQALQQLPKLPLRLLVVQHACRVGQGAPPQQAAAMSRASGASVQRRGGPGRSAQREGCAARVRERERSR